LLCATNLLITGIFKPKNSFQMSHCATILLFVLRYPLYVCNCSSNHFPLPVGIAEGSPERTTNTNKSRGSPKQSSNSNTRSLRPRLKTELLLHSGSNNYRMQINGMGYNTSTCKINGSGFISYLHWGWGPLNSSDFGWASWPLVVVLGRQQQIRFRLPPLTDA